MICLPYYLRFLTLFAVFLVVDLVMRWLDLLLVMVYFLRVYMVLLRSLDLCDLCLFFYLRGFFSPLGGWL